MLVIFLKKQSNGEPNERLQLILRFALNHFNKNNNKNILLFRRTFGSISSACLFTSHRLRADKKNVIILILGGNSFHCDCRMFWLLKNIFGNRVQNIKCPNEKDFWALTEQDFKICKILLKFIFSPKMYFFFKF